MGVPRIAGNFFFFPRTLEYRGNRTIRFEVGSRYCITFTSYRLGYTLHFCIPDGYFSRGLSLVNCSQRLTPGLKSSFPASRLIKIQDV